MNGGRGAASWSSAHILTTFSDETNNNIIGIDYSPGKGLFCLFAEALLLSIANMQRERQAADEYAAHVRREWL